MLKLIFITVLNSPHAPVIKVDINASDIKALRVEGDQCLVSHKDIEVEVRTRESCEQIKAQMRALKASPKAKKEKAKPGWF